MTPQVQALLERCTCKGWKVKRIIDNHYVLDQMGFQRFAHCHKCGVRIRWAFDCIHPKAPTESLYVGCECVRSFVDELNAKESVAFLRRKWRQKNTYFWKRFRDGVVITGTRDDGSWWAATAPRLTGHQRHWTFSPRHFDSDEAAQDYVQSCVLTGKSLKNDYAPRPTASHKMTIPAAVATRLREAAAGMVKS
jgi:hypothetical protein